jgi:signal transduction histidine kinase
MRSLSTRLVLAFALISLAGIGLAAIFVRQLVTTQFDAFVLEQRRATFIEQIGDYYAANGSWAGIGRVLAAPTAGGPGPAGAEHRSPREDLFVLADQAGVIVLSPNRAQLGRPAEPRALAQGAPVTVNGQVVGTVLPDGPRPGRNPAEERYLASTDQALGLAALTALVAALGLGLLLARLITRPVRDLTQAARQIAAGELGGQVRVRSRDELGLLAEQFNHMSADLQRATELRRRMTADIAHDLRTPLTVISGYLEAMRDETLRPTPARFAAMHDETQILLRLVEDLHTLSLADAGALPLRRRPAEPAQLLARAAQSYADAAAQLGVELAVRPAPPLPPLLVDETQLLRALGNLVRNALRHTPAGGQVALSAALAPDGVALAVADTGEGIPAEHLPNIFERFYRADPSRQQATGGSGLGLAIVRSIVIAHGGQVHVESAVGHGTLFTLTLPVGTAALASAPAP